MIIPSDIHGGPLHLRVHEDGTVKLNDALVGLLLEAAHRCYRVLWHREEGCKCDCSPCTHLRTLKERLK